MKAPRGEPYDFYSIGASKLKLFQVSMLFITSANRLF